MTNLEIEELMLAIHNEGMTSQPKDLPEHLKLAMDPKAIGDRMKLLRLHLGLSPAEMADDLGIERTYWSRFEKGHRAVTEPVAALLCFRHEVTLDFLILGNWDRLPFALADSMRSIASELEDSDGSESRK